MSQRPDVSVLLPIRNESEHVDRVISDVLNQDFVGRIELVVADGHSSDDSAEIVRRWADRDDRIVLIENEERHQSAGLNLAAERASAELLVRVDGHSRYARDYLAKSVDAQRDLGGAVGGRMNPVGRSRIGRSVAAAMNSPLTMGPARFHHAAERELVDTVYLGCFPKNDFQDVGGFRHFPSGSSEDADFYFRWRQSGRKVFVDPGIVSEYSPRETLAGLRSQYWRYGRGKTEMLWVNGRLPSLRPLVPMLLILGLVIAMGLAVAGTLWPLALLLSAWVGVLGVVGLSSSEPPFSVMLVAGVMHLSYGLGAWFGLLRGPGAVSQLRS
ncbi:MAG: glycosyltransferase family 2 protein [Acidimicrobiia bacterium]